jgi:hypothetical protein
MKHDKESRMKTLTDTEFKKKRKQMAQRRRRLIFNNDGDDIFRIGKDGKPDSLLSDKKTGSYPMTPEGLLEVRTTNLAGSHVDAVWYWGSNGMKLFFDQNSSFGQLYCVEQGPYYKRGFVAHKELMDNYGKDNLEIMIDFCHEQGWEIFYSNRMNDTHESIFDNRMQCLKLEHPDWCIGTRTEGKKHLYPDQRSLWAAYNFEIPQIRQLTVDALREVCQNYDIDGIELDYWRHLINFPEMAQNKPVTPDHLDLMNQLMRDIRKMTEEEGLKRGRPILITGRCVEDVEVSKTSGLDLQTWLDEDLVDIISLTSASEYSPPINSITQLADKTDVPVYPMISSCDIATNDSIPDQQKRRGNLPVWRGDALNKFEQGGAGLQMFNFFDPTLKQWQELGEPKKLRTLDRTYVWDYLPSQRQGRDTFGALRVTRHRWPVIVTENSSEPLPLYIGEDLSSPDNRSQDRKLTLRVRIQYLSRQHGLTITVNGEILTPSAYLPELADAPCEIWIQYNNLKSDLFKKGENLITTKVMQQTGEPVQVDQLRLDVRYE